MKKFQHYRLILFILLVFAVPLILFSYLNVFRTQSVPEADIEALLFHPQLFFDEHLFFQGVARVSGQKDQPMSIQGVVVPHHYVASKLIADVFLKLSQKPPTTLIILGPNHYESGSHSVLTTVYGWKTQFGEVYSNTSVIENLVQNNVVKEDDTVLSYEHSVSGLMPFIKFYLPETRVVPLIFKNGLNLETLREISQAIEAHINDDTIVISSVDFSHYRSAQQARAFDAITLEAMQKYDYASILKMDSDYLDSSSSIVILLMMMKNFGINTFHVIENTNSAELLLNDYDKVTSYFSIIFTQSQ